MIRAFVSVALLLSAAAVAAQAAPAKSTTPTAKPAAKSAKAKKAPEPPPVEVALPASEGEQNAAAAMTHFGHYDCEFAQQMKVAMNPKYDGYVDVTFGKTTYTMKPVLSTTGALRLEDVKGEALLLQIAYKSMLMDVKAGRRIVDECVHEKQLLAKHDAEGKPQQALLMSPEQIAAAAAATAAAAAAQVAAAAPTPAPSPVAAPAPVVVAADAAPAAAATAAVAAPAAAPAALVAPAAAAPVTVEAAAPSEAPVQR